MATIGRLVVRLQADPTGLKEGLTKGAQLLRQFTADAGRVMLPRGVSASAGQIAGAQLASRLVNQFKEDVGRAREDMFRGVLSKEQFSQIARTAAETFNKDLLKGIDELQRQKILSANTRAGLVAQLKDAGFEAGKRMAEEAAKAAKAAQAAAAKASGAHPLLGNLTTTGQRAAQQILNAMNATFKASSLRNREDLARGLISPEVFAKRANEAALAFNQGLLQGLDKLRAGGKATQAINEALVTSLKQAEQPVRRTLDEIMTRASEVMTSAGRDLTRTVTFPVLGLGTAALKTAGDFESAMIRIRAITEATSTQMADIGKKARVLGFTTQFSPADAANAMSIMAQAGLDVDTVMATVDHTMRLAAASTIEMAQAADISTSLLTALQIPTSEMGRAMDILVKATTTAKINIVDLGVSFRYVGAIAVQSGIAFSELTAALGLLGRAGFQGSFAGTALRGALTRMLKPTDDVARAMNDLGLGSIVATKQIPSLAFVISQMEKSALPAAQKTAAVMTVFGQRAGPGMAALLGQGSAALIKLTAQLDNSGGTAKRVADAQMQGLRGALRQLKSSFEELAIAMASSGLLGAVTSFARSLAALIVSISTLNPSFLKFMTIMIGVAAVLGPLLIVLGKLTAALVVLRVGFAFLIAEAGSLTALLLPGAGLIVGLTLIIFMLTKVGSEAKAARAEMDEFTRTLEDLNRQQLTALQIQYTEEVNRQAQAVAELGKKLDDLAIAATQTKHEVPFRPKDIAALEEAKTKLATLQAALTNVNKQLESLSRRDKAVADTAAEIAKIMNQLQDMPTMQAEVGGPKTALERMREQVDQVTTRMEILKSKAADVSVAVAQARDVEAQIAKVIEQQGGFYKANSDWLQLAQTLAKGIHDALDIDVSKQGRELVQRMQFARDNLDANWFGIFQQLETLGKRLDVEIANAGGVAKASADLVQGAQAVRDAIDQVRKDLGMDFDSRGVSASFQFTQALKINSQALQDFEKRYDDSINKMLVTTARLRLQFTRMDVVMSNVMTDMANTILAFVDQNLTPQGIFDNIGQQVSIFTNGIGDILSSLNPITQLFGRVGEALRPLFDTLGPALGKIATVIAEALTPVFEALAPVLEAFIPIIRAIFQTLGPILTALAPLFKALAIILEALFPIIKFVAIAFTYVAQVVLLAAGLFAKAVGSIIVGFGYIVRTIAKAVDALPFVSAKGAIRAADNIINFGKSLSRAGGEMIKSSNEMAKARKEIRGIQIDHTIDGINELGDAAREVSEELRNVPAGFKIALERFIAQLPVPVPPTVPVTPGVPVPTPTQPPTVPMPAPTLPAPIPQRPGGAAPAKPILSIGQVTIQAAAGESGEALWARVKRAAQREALATYGDTARWAEVK